MNKKFLVASVIAITTLSIGTNASAIQSVDNTFNEFTNLDDYLEFSIPRHIYAQRMEIGEEVQYSNPILLYDFEDNTIIGNEFFIISNGELIGKMDVTYIDGEYSSCFDTSISDNINYAYVNEEPIAIGGYQNSLLLYTSSNGFSYIDGVKYNQEPNQIPTELSSIEIKNSVSLNICMPYSIANISLPVSHVGNSTKNNPLGQCWASCVAMKINYEKGESLTSDDVYEDLTEDNIDFSVNGTQTALTYYGYSEYTRTGTAMRPGDVATQLRNNHPIIMHMQNSSGDDSHAVIIKGIVMDTSSSTYSIDDPNYSSTRSIVHNTNMGVVNQTISSYTSLSKVFTKWYNAFY